MRLGKTTLLGCAFALACIGCAGEKPCPRSANDDRNAASTSVIGSFVLDALHSDGAKKFKIYLAKDGSIRKTAVYVSKESLPPWVTQMADEKLGTGKDVEYEIEWYQDGQEVYEITREVDGKILELSVTRDQAVYYMEKKLEAQELPEKVAAVPEKFSNFKLEEAELKTAADGTEEYELEGKQGEIEIQLRVSAEGEILSQSRMLPAKITVDK